MLRGATRGAGADGMNTIGNFIGGYRAGLMQPTEDSPISNLENTIGFCYSMKHLIQDRALMKSVFN
jgi:hypothetical protein